MALVPVFTGQIDGGGNLILTPSEAPHRRRWLESLAGRDVEIVVRKKRTKRSLDQNALIHAIASTLADHCGNSLAEMKFELMGACWGWRTLKSGLVVPVKLHTADMTVEEATQFIDWLYPWCAEHFPEVRLGPKGAAA